MQCKDIPTVDLLISIGNKQLLEGYPGKVMFRKLEKLEDKGLIDCGVSIMHPWLTPKGEEFIANRGERNEYYKNNS